MLSYEIAVYAMLCTTYVTIVAVQVAIRLFTCSYIACTFSDVAVRCDLEFIALHVENTHHVYL